MKTSLNKPVVPVNIICGALGAGKTTAIANLLANKPADESWVVILNEFTDTGIDTLTLASAARGSFDVRMIPGGCLCCTGEADFRRQLSTLLMNEILPVRILIEPSGVGHPGGLIEELRVFENSGAIKLVSTIALIESRRVRELHQLPELIRDQVDAADVVLLSKAELVDANARACFMNWASELFPAKRFSGFSEHGVLPEQALSSATTQTRFSVLQRKPEHQHEHVEVVEREILIRSAVAYARAHYYLQRHACGWVIPPTVTFDLEKVITTLNQLSLLHDLERMKAVLRTGIDHWHLIQRWNDQVEIREIAWRQDSRVEVQMNACVNVDWNKWDEWLQSLGNS